MTTAEEKNELAQLREQVRRLTKEVEEALVLLTKLLRERAEEDK